MIMKCKKCDFEGTGPKKMHSHYLQFPSHASAGSVVRNPLVKKTHQVKKSVQSSHKGQAHFDVCPRCQLDFRKLQQAIDLL
jgi:hypothetical protein